MSPFVGPTAAEAASAPREFAALVAADPGGTYSSETIERVLKHYAPKSGAPSSLPETFAELVNTIKRPASHAPEGKGDTLAFAAYDESGAMSPFRFQYREVRANDVRLQVLYCGVCHSDLHQVRNEWGGSSYPLVPGHEVVGIVTEVGPKVTKFKVGDRAGIGCMVGSCGVCRQCACDREQHCQEATVWTYGSKDQDGSVTRGGYSTQIVARESFVLRFPDSLPMDAGAPLLCAGITTYSPLRRFGLDKPGKRVGVAGLGGLGHMAVRLAKAFGAEVTVISTSESKHHEAVTRLGADKFIVSSDAKAMAAAAASLDGIIDTIAAKHDIAGYCQLLVPDAPLVFVGLPKDPLDLRTGSLVRTNCVLAGSLIGGIKETQEMLDFCAERGVVCDVEVVPLDYINQVWDRLEKNDVRYRFVLDVAGSLVSGGGQAAAN